MKSRKQNYPNCRINHTFYFVFTWVFSCRICIQRIEWYQRWLAFAQWIATLRSATQCLNALFPSHDGLLVSATGCWVDLWNFSVVGWHQTAAHCSWHVFKAFHQFRVYSYGLNTMFYTKHQSTDEKTNVKWNDIRGRFRLMQSVAYSRRCCHCCPLRSEKTGPTLAVTNESPPSVAASDGIFKFINVAFRSVDRTKWRASCYVVFFLNRLR